jgi:hypothetical protein
MGKRIDQLTAATDAQVADSTWLHLIGDPATGQMYKCTKEQIKTALSTQKYLYRATGSEGTTLTIPTIEGKNIIVIMRESGPIYEVDSSPDEVEFTWDGTDITLGMGVNYANERFLILYNNIDL